MSALGWVALATGCPRSTGATCENSGLTCPVNTYCLFDSCLPAGEITQNLSAIVTTGQTLGDGGPVVPSVPTLFQPFQIQNVGGLAVIQLQYPQLLSGTVALPASCSADAGYPVSLAFAIDSATSVTIPGFQQNYVFQSDLQGNVHGALPVGVNFNERIATASACTAPLLNTDKVLASGTFNVASPPFLEAASTLTVAGEIRSPGPVLPVGAAVRILGTGLYQGVALSNDTLIGSDGKFSLPVPLTLVPTEPDAGCGAAECVSQLVVEVGPSTQAPNLPTMDVTISPAPVVTQPDQAIALFGDAGVRLPLDPFATGPELAVSAVDPVAHKPLPNVEIDVLSLDGGLIHCGAACHFFARQYTELNSGSTGPGFALVPGDYRVSAASVSPYGGVSERITVRVDDAGVHLVGPEGDLGDGGLTLVESPAQHLTGTVLEPKGQSPLQLGTVQALSLPDLVPVATQALTTGAFDLLVSAGSYLLLVQPAASTRFPTYFTDVTIVDHDLALSPIELLAPGQLQGIVELLDPDAGLPIPLPNAQVAFYSVQSDPAGFYISIPVGLALTDGQGRFAASAPGVDAGGSGTLTQ